MCNTYMKKMAYGKIRCLTELLWDVVTQLQLSTFYIGHGHIKASVGPSDVPKCVS